jgi:hypothetical protein
VSNPVSDEYLCSNASYWNVLLIYLLLLAQKLVRKAVVLPYLRVWFNRSGRAGGELSGTALITITIKIYVPYFCCGVL